MAFDEHLCEQLKGVTAHEAITILCENLSMGDTRVCFLNTKNREALKSFQGRLGLRGLLATDFGPIEFYGGPPGLKDYYNGNLFTLLCDGILSNWARFGTHIALVEGRV